METRGEISRWNDDKGFGFIRPKAGGEEVFLHISAFVGDRRPRTGDEVRFVTSKDAQGRLRAENVRLAAMAIAEPDTRRKASVQVSWEQESPAEEDRPSRNPSVKLAILLALCVLPALGGSQLFRAGSLPWPWFAYPLGSLVAFVFYWWDKRSAKRGAWRTPEARLHLWEFLCGWPGALIAQQVFRHKTRKVSFQVVFWSIVLMHQVGWLLLLLR